jgi:hypothetical protein
MLTAIDPPVLDPGDHHLTAGINDDEARIDGPMNHAILVFDRGDGTSGSIEVNAVSTEGTTGALQALDAEFIGVVEVLSTWRLVDDTLVLSGSGVELRYERGR